MDQPQHVINMKTTVLTFERNALAIATLLFFILFIVNFAGFFVGYIASDDAFYIIFARQWLDHGFTLPNAHWGFRYTIVLPIYGLEWGLENPPEFSYSLIPAGLCLSRWRSHHLRRLALAGQPGGAGRQLVVGNHALAGGPGQHH